MTPAFLNRIRNEAWAIVPSHLDVLRESMEHAQSMASVLTREAGKLVSLHGDTAVISVSGATGKRLDFIEREWLGMVDYDDIAEAVDQVEHAEEVRSIVFAFDSPGGAVLGLQELAGRIRAIEKPTYSFTDTLMASAAYYLASQTDSIYASPSASVGSIGTRIVHMEQSGFLDSIGVKVSLFGKGAHKNDFSSYRPLSDEEREALQGMCDKGHAEFRKAVESNRIVDESVFESKLYDSDDALPLGLIDGHLNSLAELLGFLE